MKFIMLVLTIRFVAEMIVNKIKKMNPGRENEMIEFVRHPAEYGLR